MSDFGGLGEVALMEDEVLMDAGIGREERRVFIPDSNAPAMS